jgi:hypothetical protein
MDKPMNSTNSDNWQQQDEEQAFLRCVELVQMAQRGEKFKQQDIDDLMAQLGVSNYFKGG